MSDWRSKLPGVDRLLATPAFEGLLSLYPRDRVVQWLRKVLDELRKGKGEGEPRGLDDAEWYAREVGGRLAEDDRPTLRPVINATGVVLHTNLGRAPLADSVREAMARAGGGYSNLEFDLYRGERGSRYHHCVSLLTELTGAERALVVNNNAAAVVLALNTLALGREVVVSRGELVEIGGGFRIPEILSRAGAALREVGTTNRTRLQDYRDVVERDEVAVILKVHRSNFRISGFTEEASLADLAALAGERGIPLVHDLGSGMLVDSSTLGLPFEPRPQESLADGASVVSFSGDKLLGGPQAGILLGSHEVVEAMRKNPLCRALRVDKVTLAGLEATLRLYRDPERAIREIPVLRMLGESQGAVKERVLRGAEDLRGAGFCDEGLVVEDAPGSSVVGGGTYPEVEIPSWTLRIHGEGVSMTDFAASLRTGDPPVVGRVEDDALLLDLRTVSPEEETELVRRLLETAAGV